MKTVKMMFRQEYMRPVAAAAAGAAASLLLFSCASAYELTVPFPDSSTNIQGPASYIKTLYSFGIGFGALLAILMIVIGGIEYTVSEAIPSKQDAKDRIMKAILGLVLLTSAVLILQIINPDLPKLIEPRLQTLPPPAPAAPPAPPAPAPGAGTQPPPTSTIGDVPHPPVASGKIINGQRIVEWQKIAGDQIDTFEIRAGGNNGPVIATVPGTQGGFAIPNNVTTTNIFVVFALNENGSSIPSQPIIFSGWKQP